MDTDTRKEIGRARSISRLDPLRDDNAKLRFPQSANIYAKMGREDAQVTSVYRAVTLPIRRAGWRINANGAPDEVAQLVAQDLRLRVNGEDPNKPMPTAVGKVSWTKHLEQVMRALQFGHMFFEQVYAPGPDGREHLVKLAPRWPGSVKDIRVEDDGGLAGIEQINHESGDPIFIPVHRLVAYVFDDVGNSWQGTSIFRPAYKHWVLRDELLRLELQVLDRNGMGLPVMTVSDISNNPDRDLEDAERVVQDARSGESAGIALPAGAKFNIAGTTGQIVSPRDAIQYHDGMIARSMLAHFLNLDGKGGSYALASTQSDLFVQSLQTTAEWVADVASQHVIEDLVRVAFPDYTGTFPRIAFDPIASRKEITAGELSQLVAGGLVYPDRDLEEELRDRYGLPPKQRLDDALRIRKHRLEKEAEMGIKLAPDKDEDAGAAPAPNPEDQKLLYPRENTDNNEI